MYLQMLKARLNQILYMNSILDLDLIKYYWTQT